MSSGGAIVAKALLIAAVIALQGCGDRQAENTSKEGRAQQSGNSHERHDPPADRPTNQVAVLTVWAATEKLEQTAEFYENVLGLRLVGSGAGQYILDTDGSFLVIMEGQVDPPRNTKRRWPQFALTVPDLERSIEMLKGAEVELPWGVEEFGAPDPSSRYVMFYDPAGNLIEIVEWL